MEVNGIEEEERVEEIAEEVVDIPPNGGYGWVVVAGAFLVHVFILGNIYSFGVFLPVQAEAFNASVGETSWIGSVGFGIFAFLGSFAGQWADRFGNDRMVFIGGLIVALAYFLASICTELWQLYLTQGLLAGIGSRYNSSMITCMFLFMRLLSVYMH
jgi:MFS family permease